MVKKHCCNHLPSPQLVMTMKCPGLFDLLCRGIEKRLKPACRSASFYNTTVSKPDFGHAALYVPPLANPPPPFCATFCSLCLQSTVIYSELKRLGGAVCCSNALRLAGSLPQCLSRIQFLSSYTTIVPLTDESCQCRANAASTKGIGWQVTESPAIPSQFNRLQIHIL